ncbi:MAG: hypothetical protein KY460_17465 [Actinobacteria bacterium]|nr:hypothetical protein [Actinomycetota bacterium]
MWKWLRWLLLALLVYFVVVRPREAADVTRQVVEGAIALFTGAAESIAAFLSALV